MLGAVAGSLVVAILSAPAIAAPSVAANCGNVQILSDQMTAGEAEAYCRYAVKERQKSARQGITRKSGCFLPRRLLQ